MNKNFYFRIILVLTIQNVSCFECAYQGPFGSPETWSFNEIKLMNMSDAELIKLGAAELKKLKENIEALRSNNPTYHLQRFDKALQSIEKTKTKEFSIASSTPPVTEQSLPALQNGGQ